MTTLAETFSEYGLYVDDLMRRLVLLVKIFVVVFLAGFFLTGRIIKSLLLILDTSNVLIVATSPFQMIDLAMSTGFFLAAIFVTPIAIYHLYAFFRPGLLPKERKTFILLIPVGLLLFALGFAYGFGILYYAITLIAQVNVGLGVVNYWDIGKFSSEIFLTSSLLGVIFQFPIIITFLMRIGILTVDILRNKRRHAIVIIFILTSLLPPTDGLSLILMALPMVLIYEITILVNSRYKKVVGH